jgi:hypothetical protein
MESDPDFIPRSARMEFVFHLSKQAKETMEFSSLLQETETILSEVRQQLKKKILAATKIEIKICMSTITEAMAKAFRLAVQAFVIVEQNKDVDIDTLTRKIVSMHSATLLKHAGCTGPEFDILYLKLNKEADDDDVEVVDVDADDNEEPMDTSADANTTTGTAPPEAAAPTQSSYFSQSQSQPSQFSEASTATGILTQQSQASSNEPLASLAIATTTAPTAPPTPAATTLPEPEIPTLAISNALRAVFVTTWDEYLKQQEKNAVALELKKLHADYFATDSTKKAVKLVDDESPASRDQLRSLVRVEIQEEIHRTEKKPTTKKKPPPSSAKKQQGRSQGGASQQSKKKTATTNKNKTANRQTKTSRSPSRGRQSQRGQRDRRADGSANDSNNGNNSRGRSNKRGNAGKKKKASNTTRTRR